jgi:glutamyl/glutaminyl-tRNA synthetase
MKVTSYKKTRIAPTPSGYLHLGNVLSFAITAVLAEKTRVKLLLRIDDMDRARVNKLYLQDIFDTLNFMEIGLDEGPQNVADFEANYSQLHRLDIYKQALKQLADNGTMFTCTCSRKQLKQTNVCNCYSKHLPLNTENASWRLITDSTTELTVKSYKSQNISAALPADLYNFVVRKKDGFPSYQLTSIIDDLFYGIDLVVRGEDLWPSTIAQHQLALALGENDFGDITFFHHPLLTETSGEKLSKSAGATSIKHLRESGKKPADIYRLIAKMLGIKEAIINREQLVSAILTSNNQDIKNARY